MKTLFSSNDKSMNHESSSTLQEPLQPIEVILNCGLSPGYELGAKSVSLSPEQVKTEIVKRWCPTTKPNRYRRLWFHRPKPVFMGRDKLIVNHALYSRIAEGGDF